MSVAASLANLTLNQLNFTANCSNLALGLYVFENDFNFPTPNPGNYSYDNSSYYNSSVDDGPSDNFEDFWTNGTSPEWISFWRYTLSSVLPAEYLSLSDEDIARWANTTEAFNFFDDDVDSTPALDLLSELSYDLAESGGCRHNASTNIEDIVGYEQACMVQYCCSSALNSSVSRNPKGSFPFISNLSIEDACAFNTCQQSNKGNPDLGGIGVIVAYFIEASLLALSLIMFGIKLITDRVTSRRNKANGELLVAHEAAVLASTGVFLDTSVYFALSICFAAIIFNYRDKPLLYEDKLGQASTLLTINAPVAIMLLSYTCVDRKNFRIFLVAVAALMTFIIQFLFRKAASFNVGAGLDSNLCLNWDSFVEKVFEDRFIVKAVWAGLVFLFFVGHFVSWVDLKPKPRWRIRMPRKMQRKWEGMMTSPSISKVSRSCGFLYSQRVKVPWESLAAYLLAVYALFDSYYDIRFLWYLRNQEKDISSNDTENQWGYGQILAVFVWVPVLVEYFYILGWKLRFWGKSEAREQIAEGSISHKYAEVNQEQVVAKMESDVLHSD